VGHSRCGGWKRETLHSKTLGGREKERVGGLSEELDVGELSRKSEVSGGGVFSAISIWGECPVCRSGEGPIG